MMVTRNDDDDDNNRPTSNKYWTGFRSQQMTSCSLCDRSSILGKAVVSLWCTRSTAGRESPSLLHSHNTDLDTASTTGGFFLLHTSKRLHFLVLKRMGQFFKSHMHIFVLLFYCKLCLASYFCLSEVQCKSSLWKDQPSVLTETVTQAIAPAIDQQNAMKILSTHAMWNKRETVAYSGF
jgi:hypothetical protein